MFTSAPSNIPNPFNLWEGIYHKQLHKASEVKEPKYSPELNMVSHTIWHEFLGLIIIELANPTRMEE